MKYDTPELTVKAGKKINLIFANANFMRSIWQKTEDRCETFAWDRR